MTDTQFKIVWIDRHREPQCPPNPLFPNGIDLDVSDGALACRAELPYPAKRCGYYFVECQKCLTNALITTAGRADDPKSVKLTCALADHAVTSDHPA